MEFVSGNNFIRPMQFAAVGEVVDGHAHNFDHTTYCTRGAVRIEKLDADGNALQAIELHAVRNYNWALIKAGVSHRITALEANSMCHCIYAHRTPQGEIVQQFDGWSPSYE
jgi:quercetin dioxygenase-like cupin family protein